jgi:hypothetical protein
LRFSSFKIRYLAGAWAFGSLLCLSALGDDLNCKQKAAGIRKQFDEVQIRSKDAAVADCQLSVKSEFNKMATYDCLKAWKILRDGVNDYVSSIKSSCEKTQAANKACVTKNPSDQAALERCQANAMSQSVADQDTARKDLERAVARAKKIESEYAISVGDITGDRAKLEGKPDKEGNTNSMELGAKASLNGFANVDEYKAKINALGAEQGHVLYSATAFRKVAQSEISARSTTIAQLDQESVVALNRAENLRTMNGASNSKQASTLALGANQRTLAGTANDPAHVATPETTGGSTSSESAPASVSHTGSSSIGDTADGLTAMTRSAAAVAAASQAANGQQQSGAFGGGNSLSAEANGINSGVRGSGSGSLSGGTTSDGTAGGNGGPVTGSVTASVPGRLAATGSQPDRTVHGMMPGGGDGVDGKTLTLGGGINGSGRSPVSRGTGASGGSAATTSDDAGPAKPGKESDCPDAPCVASGGGAYSDTGGLGVSRPFIGGGDLRPLAGLPDLGSLGDKKLSADELAQLGLAPDATKAEVENALGKLSAAQEAAIANGEDPAGEGGSGTSAGAAVQSGIAKADSPGLFTRVHTTHVLALKRGRLVMVPKKL